MSLSSLLGRTAACACGREHTVTIKEIVIQSGALAEVGRVAGAVQPGRRALLVADDNTWRIAGAAAADALGRAGFQVSTCRVTSKTGRVHADDRGIGQVLAACVPEIELLVAAGSGSVTDLTRFVAARTGRPFLAVATAPSMDGYTSSVAPAVIAGLKRTYPASAPLAVLADLDILAAAPPAMVAAGYGDLIGKYTARADWILARSVLGEHYCPQVMALLEPALTYCLAHPREIADRVPEALASLTEGLMLSGIMIMMVGSSRPASGAEHDFAHFWDIEAAAAGLDGALHGEMVGLATPIVTRIYERVAELGLPPASWLDLYADAEAYGQRMRAGYGPLAEAIVEFNRPRLGRTSRGAAARLDWQVLLAEARRDLPHAGELQAALDAVGCPTRVSQIGLGPEDLRRAIVIGREVRQRYGVTELAAEAGLLDGLVEGLVAEFA